MIHAPYEIVCNSSGSGPVRYVSLDNLWPPTREFLIPCMDPLWLLYRSTIHLATILDFKHGMGSGNPNQRRCKCQGAHKCMRAHILAHTHTHVGSHTQKKNWHAPVQPYTSSDKMVRIFFLDSFQDFRLRAHKPSCRRVRQCPPNCQSRTSQSPPIAAILHHHPTQGQIMGRMHCPVVYMCVLVCVCVWGCAR